MARQPIAFLSYVREDDAHDASNISFLRAKLEGELEMQTGAKFPIFQDRNDLAWGDAWAERIKKSLLEVTFLIPIITPRFFRSLACREEFETFLLREKQLGLNHLILPIYYVTARELTTKNDTIGSILSARQYADWRELRFHKDPDPKIKKAIAELAVTVRDIMELLEVELDAARQPPKPVRALTGATPRAQKNETPSIFIPDVPDALDLFKINKKWSPLLPKYYAFTTQFDEIIASSELTDPESLLKVQKYTTSHASKLRVAHRKQIESIAAKVKTTQHNVSVSFLLDNSGSMRGVKTTTVASWMSILADVIEGMGIGIEVLGFTTRAWKGGQSRETWLAKGKPEKPGRLNDLRHIIYKGFDQPAIETANNYSAMTLEGNLKENIDGEAILWALDRINRRHGRKCIFVISDGAPVDDSTLSQNDDDFLERHLIDVISYVHTMTAVSLVGVGLGFDVKNYYPKHILISKASFNMLGPKLLSQVVEFCDSEEAE